MPNKASAVKALRQGVKRAAQNKGKLMIIRDLARHFRKALDENNTATAETLIKDLIVSIDKAAKKHIIKKNTASRKKSRLMKKLNSILKK